MPKACAVRRARNSDQNAKRGVGHCSNESRRYSTPLSLEVPPTPLARADEGRIATLLLHLLTAGCGTFCVSAFRRINSGTIGGIGHAVKPVAHPGDVNDPGCVKTPEA